MKNVLTVVFVLVVAVAIARGRGKRQHAEAKVLKRPLEGRTFRCCALLEFPNIVHNPSRLPYKLDGLAINYLASLEEQLGFRCSEMQVVSSFADVGFTSYIEAQYNCSSENLPQSNPLCKCDIGVGGWNRNTGRNNLVHFTPEFSRSTIDIVVHRADAGNLNNGAFFIIAFPWPVWGIIIAFIFAFSFIRVLDRNFERPINPPQLEAQGTEKIAQPAQVAEPAEIAQLAPVAQSAQELLNTKHKHVDMDNVREEGSHVSSDLSTKSFFGSLRHRFFSKQFGSKLYKAFCDSFLDMFGIMDPPHRSEHHKSFRQTLVTLVLFVFGLVVLKVFEASMVAVLVADVVRHRHASLDGLRRCRIPPEAVCIPKGGAAEAFWRNSIATDGCHRNRSAQLVPTYPETLQRLVQRKCSYLVAGLAAKDVASGQHCAQVAKVGDPLWWGGNSFVFRLDTPPEILRIFSQATLQLKEQNQLESVEDFFKKRGNCGTGETYGQVQLKQLSTFFLTALGAWVGLLVIILFSNGISGGES